MGRPTPTARASGVTTPQAATADVGEVVYLRHFARPYRHARHYLGTTRDLDARLAAHAAGGGARLLAVIAEAGIGFTVARLWRGGRRLERALKRCGGATRFCPVCRPGTTWGRMTITRRRTRTVAGAHRTPATRHRSPF